MSKFALTIDLTDHEHPENPAAQRAFILQKLQEAAQQVGRGHPDPRIKTGEVQPNHESARHARGDITAGGAFEKKKIGSWEFT
jgi:hypothetical protein